MIKDADINAEDLIRYALSQPVTVAIVGCMSPKHVRELACVGRNFEPMGQEEQFRLVDIYRPYADKLAYYRGVF